MSSTSASPLATTADDPADDDTAAVVVRCRHRIDEIDQQLISLIRQRAALSADVQSARRATGEPHLALAREGEIIRRYSSSLGRLGTELAMLLMRLSRGSAAGGQ